jgi:hypothetical protein
LTADLTLARALERLTTLLATDGPELLETLRPPATDRELDELRAVIDPHDIPPELESMWRWHNGQQGSPEDVPRFLPLPEGNFLGTREAADAYRFLTEETEPWQWCRLWIPLVQHRWAQSGVESVPQGPSVVVVADFGSTDTVIVSSSLAALMHGTADLFERGSWDMGNFGPKEREAVQTRSEQVGWGNWPRERVLPNDVAAANWPDHWRAANGL